MDSGHVLSTVEEELYSTYSDNTAYQMKHMQTASSHSRFSIRQSINEKSIGPHPISPQELTRHENPPIFEEPDEGKEEAKTRPFLESKTESDTLVSSVD